MKCYALAIRQNSEYLQFHFPKTFGGFIAEVMYNKYRTEITDFSRRFDDGLIPSAVEIRDGICFNAYKGSDKSLCIVVSDRALEKKEAFFLFYHLLIKKIPVQTVIQDPEPYLYDPKIAEVRTKLDETTEIMLSNIEKTILRGEGINGLLDNSIELKIASDEFKEEAKKLNSCWPAWGCSIL